MQEDGQQERGRNAREGRHEARPLDGREPLLGELDREPDRRKEGRRVEQHRNVRGVRVLEASVSVSLATVAVSPSEHS